MFGLSTRATDCGGYPASILTLLTIPTPGGAELTLQIFTTPEP